MKLIKKVTILSIMLGISVLPSFAKLDGGISKNHFYDTEKTIMTETPLNKTLTTGKYWEKNLFYFNKYRPIFMLSNKELYDLIPRENINVAKMISAPAVYNISLKTASIKTFSISEPIVSAKIQAEPKKQIPQNNIIINNQNNKTKLTLIYEQAKNPEIDSDDKVDAAILLKNSKDLSNCKLAIDLLDDVTKKEPYNAYAFFLKGELYSEKKDYQNAMKNYIESLKINPTSKQSCLGIAKILKPTNKELSQKYYNRAMLLSEK